VLEGVVPTSSFARCRLETVGVESCCTLDLDCCFESSGLAGVGVFIFVPLGMVGAGLFKAGAGLVVTGASLLVAGVGSLTAVYSGLLSVFVAPSSSDKSTISLETASLESSAVVDCASLAGCASVDVLGFWDDLYIPLKNLFIALGFYTVILEKGGKGKRQKKEGKRGKEGEKGKGKREKGKRQKKEGKRGKEGEKGKGKREKGKGKREKGKGKREKGKGKREKGNGKGGEEKTNLFLCGCIIVTSRMGFIRSFLSNYLLS
jgi:hypothetical protein